MRIKYFRCFLAFLCLVLKSTGYSQATLPAFWTFINPSPSADSTAAPSGWTTRLNLTVSGSTPYVYATGSDKNAACRLDGTGEFVKVAFTEPPGPLSYYLKGTGISPNPAFTGTFTVEQSTDGSVWQKLRTHTLLTGSFVRMVDFPSTSARFIRFYYTDKQSGSNVALDSILLRPSPPSPLPKLGVKTGSWDLVSGSEIITGNDSLITLTLENKGSSDTLRLFNPVISGPASSDYTLSGFPQTISASGKVSCIIRFKAKSNGSRKAQLQFGSNDTNKKTFVVKFYGIGGPFADEPAAQPRDLRFSNVKPFGVDLDFTPPATAPEYYLVLRKSGNSLTETPVDGRSYLRGDTLGKAKVAYVGSAAQFKPGYILAGTEYTFSVFAFNGPKGFENYLTPGPLTAYIRIPGGDYGTYYQGIDPSGTDFIQNLSKKINLHDTLFYSNYSSNLIDRLLAFDTIGGKKAVRCVYTGTAVPYSDPFVWWGNGSTGNLSREHTYAQSWMPSNQGGSWPNSSNGKELPEYNDLHHLFPSDQLTANVKRSNLPFGEVSGTPDYVSPTGAGKVGKNAKGVTVYEPASAHKGDLARALFYMCVAYNGINGQLWKLPASQDQEVLKKWHAQDPPSPLEVARHELIASLQKNRNPFIDRPEFSNRINFTSMSYVADSILSMPVFAAESPIKVYPNPSGSGIFNLETQFVENVYITDVFGQKILQIHTSKGPIKIDLSSFPEGVYWLNLQNRYHFKLLHQNRF